ncbi:acylpyruvase FAHD1, mitochondrial-like isoform X1 [Amphibalanus amphitrite]|uniref:acylpyruvase FAHD1, mitochondrial-like isoform X1 n=2 Tax=Amphibalanus amphitrite TaxID=1232801 RepID=UPI001C914184|nr:acylpyruvase FAHD1, mitochondrial-like isoform X1 [Amphibalanus amphitrite]XP_043194688.1 acylpyruvase FAHD1, mitochondrial-like isoform X1 [Amphibalanus amphitrite]XP_043194695.1 acylpyruvase FAHD1, mitochondrial-like isoform X1 [Amphibalanus amphitrite]XP_043194705.1 acylpyruvase FAHD1, mitochondrial-like isoform X1 [Amphibalanus amphitrite]XP_043194713.1 acylpyruvase FAHD1, mitochondrial-like isoform X1 [Amphibalanus amphitrite]XP_043194724.1 acylpyruvase FAHD1, mitochondrial-like isofor
MSSFSRFTELGRKIVAVGRNYREHAAELGNKMPDKPMLFLKPTSSYLTAGNIKIPEGCSELHHEVELGVVISEKCSAVPEGAAMQHVAGYALALDMTARDFQNEAKAKGHPWTMAKCFDTACPVSAFVPRDRIPDTSGVRLHCSVNGQTRQDGATADMHFSVPFLISYISRYITLEPGDLVLTGTPAGVGPVRAGDVIEATMADQSGGQLTKITFGVEKSSQS